MVVHLRPYFLDAERVAAEQDGLREVLDHARRRRRAVAVGNGGLADATQAGVGDNFREHRVQATDPHEIDVDLHDLHVFAPENANMRANVPRRSLSVTVKLRPKYRSRRRCSNVSAPVSIRYQMLTTDSTSKYLKSTL